MEKIIRQPDEQRKIYSLWIPFTEEYERITQLLVIDTSVFTVLF